MLALLAVAGATIADLLEPWPPKILLDHLLLSKLLPDWLSKVVTWMGTDTLAVLNFAVLAAAVIAVVGAFRSYLEKYLTTSVGQWVMHDLRRTLYPHIHRLPLAEDDKKRTGNLIGRVPSLKVARTMNYLRREDSIRISTKSGFAREIPLRRTRSRTKKRHEVVSGNGRNYRGQPHGAAGNMLGRRGGCGTVPGR